MDKYNQLVEDLVVGNLNLIHIQIAIREYVRRSKNIPDNIKDILSGTDEANPGLIFKMFLNIQLIIGNIELAYRRGVHAGKNGSK